MAGHKKKLKSILFQVASWLITVVALYFAFRDINWPVFFAHLGNADPLWILLGVILTCSSYFLRARRWQHLFPAIELPFLDSYRVLVLGFFMNNILPARAGEFVRAHLGSKVTGETRTLVLATIASERLADGLTLSLMFILFSFGIGDHTIATNLSYVALLFGGATLGVLLVLFLRQPLFNLADQVCARLNHKASDYTLNRIKIFVNGLAPLFSLRSVPLITLWSVLIWSVELAVYLCIVQAFDSPLPLSHCVLFMVTLNFSSLIPAAPGGIGVIEAVTSAVLISLGVEKEHALSMVIVQHVIQYLVVCIPGAVILSLWHTSLKELEDSADQVEQLPEGNL